MYREIINMAFAPSRPTPVSSKIASGGTQRMDVEDPDPTNQVEEARLNITVGNHIISIIFTIHNINRQKTKGVETNMIKKTSGTAFKIHYKGNDYPLESEELMKTWERITKENNLIYKEFSQGDTENWYGTMGPYIDMFSAYALRTNELRLGHNNMPITKVDGVHRSFPVSKYGLSGAHHVLLEGTSFPPERRSSIVQSLGPMTAWLCMIRSEGLYRNKYAAAVKRAMSHIPCIDDIIEITKTTKQASEISMLTTLIAEILLITTARQATRMFFPITIFAYVWGLHANPRDFCDFFSTTGAGGWYTYKAASERNPAFTICGKMETEKASQIVFHSIFGTYKEDLSILSQITSVSLWYTREQMGTCFRQQGSSTSTTKIELPKMRFYAKMSCANQTGLLSGVYNQVVTVPCFSGKRTHRFDESFFDHIEKKKIISTSGKTISQIVNILTSILEELHATIKRDQGKIQMGTTQWRDMGSLDLNTPGDTVNIVLEGSGKMFLGKN
uniref:Nucleocapsid protein n=1 Tax=Lepidopteran orthomyxo-related virus OKIAV178 TaxID=2746278 RepID=A0A7D7JZK1_9ORTO|nr:nucleocapsid protein [Lepidopteran orthomyxo-related virus OKIAV178]